MTAHDTALANAAERRTFTPAESDRLVDVARLIDVDHARYGTQCACEDEADGGSWTNDQRTYGEHIAAELAKASHLRDSDRELTRLRLHLEQMAAALAVATGQSLTVVRLGHGLTTQESK